MNADALFEEAWFVDRYRSESEDFYRPFFENDERMNDFFYSVFKNDGKDRRPRWMMNDIQRFVSLANDIAQIRPGYDPLRILFLRICLESLRKDSGGAEPKTFYQTFASSFSDAGKQYILSNFTFFGIQVPDELTGKERACFNPHNFYSLTCEDFLNVIRATRNMVVHDGDYWSMNFFAYDTESTWITSLTTDEEIISCQPRKKDRKLTYCFHTTMEYEKFIVFFVEACLNYLKSYIEKQSNQQ